MMDDSGSAVELQAVLFDMDGVVADTHSIHKEGWRQTLVNRGRPVDEHVLSVVLEGRRRDEIIRLLFGDVPADEAALIAREKEESFRLRAHQVTTLPGIPELLEELHGLCVPVALATSASRGRAVMILSQLGLETKFHVVVCGDDVPASKPNPAIFLIAAQKLGVPPHQTLVLEDSTAGVLAAKAAGMTCLAVAPQEVLASLAAAGADHAVTSCEGLSWKDIQALTVSRQKRHAVSV
jgi:HAD superfamily hydrolase (TIGR01509 family)